MQAAKTIITKYNKWLWSSKKSKSFAEQLTRDSLQIISALTCDLRQGQLSLRAMSLVYTTIISLIPLFAISFSVLKGLGAHNQIRPFLLNTLDALGDKKFEIADKIIGFVNNIQVGVLGAVGIAILIYTVIGMMQKIEFSFNYIWNVPKSRSFAKRVNDYLSILFIAPLLIFLSTAMTASVKTNYVIDKIGNIYGIDLVMALIGFVIPYLILALAFTFLYSFIPNTKVKFKAAFISGLITALIWKIMGFVFSSFVADSANHAAIYSAFATILVFMIWVYLVWLILLIGASIGFYIQYAEYRKTSHNIISLNTELKESLAIEIMTEIAKRFHKHKTSLGINELAKTFRQPDEIIEEICEYMQDADLIITEEQTGSLFPGKPLEHISIYDIIMATRKCHNNQTELNGKEAMKYLDEFDKLLAKTFKKKTLHDLV